MSDERLSVGERKYNDVFKPLYDNGKYSAALGVLEKTPEVTDFLSEEERSKIDGLKGLEGRTEWMGGMSC